MRAINVQMSRTHRLPIIDTSCNGVIAKFRSKRYKPDGPVQLLYEVYDNDIKHT